MDHCFYCRKRIWPWQERYIHTAPRIAHASCDLEAIKEATQLLVKKGKMTVMQKKWYDIMREAAS